MDDGTTTTQYLKRSAVFFLATLIGLGLGHVVGFLALVIVAPVPIATIYLLVKAGYVGDNILVVQSLPLAVVGGFLVYLWLGEFVYDYVVSDLPFVISALAYVAVVLFVGASAYLVGVALGVTPQTREW